jgi:nitroreductase
MNVDVAIKDRRSIRKYKEKTVPKELIKKTLEAGTYAPSAKNGQQWRFQVFMEEPKMKLTDAFRKGLEETKRSVGEKNMGSSFNSCSIMEKAPIVVMVWNAQSTSKDRLIEVIENARTHRMSRAKEFVHMAALQGVSAAVQNMLLTAHSLGLGSLWINDIYYATEDLEKFLGKPWELVAAVTLGWPTDEEANKPPHTRLGVDEVTEFYS